MSLITVLNTLTVLLGAIATLSAFGGETWRKGDEPLLTRITSRGWLSLFCLAATVSSGVFKESLAASASRLANIERDVARHQAETANAKLRSIQDELSLSTTKLSEQSRINLLLTLASGSLVSSTLWVSDYEPGSKATNEPISAIFGSVPEILRPLVEATVAFHPFGGAETNTLLTYREKDVLYKYPYERSIADQFRRVRICLVKQPPDSPTCSRYSLSQNFDKNNYRPSAATAYRGMTEEDSVAFFSLRLVKRFSTMNERADYLKRNPHLEPLEEWQQMGSMEHGVTFRIPNDVAEATERALLLFASAATLRATLSGGIVEFTASTKVKEVKRTPSEVSLRIVATNPIRIEVPSKKGF